MHVNKDFRSMTIKQINEMTRQQSIQFVKDFRTMWWHEFSGKYQIPGAHVAYVNDIANDLIKKFELTDKELAKDGTTRDS